MEKHEAYAGRWIAHLGGEIIAHGSSPLRAQRAAIASRPKEKAEILFVQNNPPLSLPKIVDKIKLHFAQEQKLYLVGGAVRDKLLSIESKDYDFVVEENAIALGRRVANHFKGEFYVLDKERDAGRVILKQADEKGLFLDFIAQKGTSIDEDLIARDFSINAMAIALDEQNSLYDPCEGANDLHNKSLVACRKDSIEQDPIRILRAIRLAAQFDLRIEKSTLRAIKENVSALENSSPERMRDEFWRILEIPNVRKSLHALQFIGALQIVFPELAPLNSMEQSPPHNFNVWEHTLRTVESLEKILSLLDEDYPSEGARSLFGGLVVLSLGRYREEISKIMKQEFVDGRKRRYLLLLAALLHDAGKGITQEIAGDRIRYSGHESEGAKLAKARMQTLRFSRAEIETVAQIIAAHKRPTEISRAMDTPDERSIFHYFRELDNKGIDVGLHSIADLMGRHGLELKESVLSSRLEIIRSLFEAYFHQYDSLIAPKPLIDGDEIMQHFELEPGPKIGEIADMLLEAQAIGEINSTDEAYKLAKSYLENTK